MSIQQGVLNNHPIIEDSATPGVPVTAVFGSEQDVVASNASVMAQMGVTSPLVVADLVGLNCQNDQIVKLAGYYTAGDGGGQEVIYRSTGRSGITVDNGFFFAGGGADDYFEALEQEVMNVKRFGAVGDGTTDNSAVFQLLTDKQPSVVRLPPGDYLINQTLQLTGAFDWQGIESRSIITANNLTGTNSNLDGAVVYMNENNSILQDCKFSDVTLAGTATTGINIFRARFTTVENIRLARFSTFTDGFVFSRCFGSSFNKLNTGDADTSRFDFAFAHAVNACHFSNLYTGGAGDHSECCFYFNWQWLGGTEGSTNNSFNGLLAQKSLTGVYMRLWDLANFDGLYCEGVEHNVVVGNYGPSASVGTYTNPRSPRACYGINFTNVRLQSPDGAHPNKSTQAVAFDFEYAIGCTLKNVWWIAGFNDIGTANPVTVVGDGAGAVVRAIAHPNDGSINAVTVVEPGTGYTTATINFTGPGAGAAATANIGANSGIDDITVTATGSGYTSVMYPVRFHHAYKCSIENPIIVSELGNQHGPLWPYVCRRTPAAFSPYQSVSVDYDGYWIGSSNRSNVKLVPGEGDDGPHVLEYYDVGEVHTRRPYTPWTFDN